MSERGDKGITQVGRILEASKDCAFTEAVGSIDSFQASLGMARVMLIGENNQKIRQVQSDLYDIMSSLYLREEWQNGEKRVEEINEEINLAKGRVENLTSFLIPGDNELDARLNVCRTDCREAERRVVTLKTEREKENEEIDKNIVPYFNKLSSFLYWKWRAAK